MFQKTNPIFGGHQAIISERQEKFKSNDVGIDIHGLETKSSKSK